MLTIIRLRTISTNVTVSCNSSINSPVVDYSCNANNIDYSQFDSIFHVVFFLYVVKMIVFQN